MGNSLLLQDEVPLLLSALGTAGGRGTVHQDQNWQFRRLAGRVFLSQFLFPDLGIQQVGLQLDMSTSAGPGLVVTADGVEDGSGGFFHLRDCVAQFLQFILRSTDGGRLARPRGSSERDGAEGRVGLDWVVIEMDIR